MPREQRDDLAELHAPAAPAQDARTLRAELEASESAFAHRAEEFSHLLEVSQLIVSELDLARVLQLVVERARELVRAETVLVPMLDAARDAYTYVAAAGDDAELVRGTTFAAHVGMCGWVLRNGRSLLFGETTTRWTDEVTPWEAGQQSAVLVPLIGRSGIIGGLSALGKRGGRCFTRHDRDLLTLFANQVGAAVENARLFQELKREVEERRAAERSVRASERLVRTILDTLDEGLVVVDRDYRIRVANRATAAMVSSSAEALAGRPCWVARRLDRPCFELGQPCAVARVFADGAPASAAYRVERPGAPPRFVETRAYPLRDADGRVTTAIELVIDTTGRHQLEEERARAQKLEAVGTLAGGIAHDFNNLLQGVFGLVSLMGMQLDDPSGARATLAEIEQALRQSVKLTNQLLTFAKGGKPTKKAIELAPLVLAAAQFTLSGSATRVRVVPEEGLWPVDADDGQIYQVVQNVVLNAAQAMPAGGEVGITLRNVRAPGPGAPPELPAGPYVRVDVTDTGGGIPEKDLGRIFEPYFTTKAKGSGLGLATAYSIVRNHGGALGVTATSPAGTTMTLHLPATVEPQSVAPAAPAVTTRSGRAAHVLVMDDEPVILGVTERLLRRLGHRPELATHGQEVLARYEAARRAGDPFDLVILDVTIRGGMGGVETARRLQALDPAARAVLSSGYSDESAADAAGIAGYLKKPYDLGELREALARALEGR